MSPRGPSVDSITKPARFGYDPVSDALEGVQTEDGEQIDARDPSPRPHSNRLRNIAHGPAERSDVP